MTDCCSGHGNIPGYAANMFLAHEGDHYTYTPHFKWAGSETNTSRLVCGSDLAD